MPNPEHCPLPRSDSSRGIDTRWRSPDDLAVQSSRSTQSFGKLFEQFVIAEVLIGVDAFLIGNLDQFR